MGDGEGSELVNWDGVLTQDERRKILSRLRSAFAEVGARVPDTVELNGARVPLRDTVLGYLERESLSGEELERVEALCDALEDRVAEAERGIREGDIDEATAVGLMREALGILRALSHLRRLRDPERRRLAREVVMSRVEDERRWLRFVKRVRR